MNDPTIVSVIHGLAERHELVQQPNKNQGVAVARETTLVVVGNDVPHGAAANQFHRVERPVILFVVRKLVNRHDPRMFELTRHPRLADEPCTCRPVVGPIVPEFFQGHVSPQLVVPGNPNLANPPFTMEPCQRVAIAPIQVVLDRSDQLVITPAIRPRIGHSEAVIQRTTNILILHRPDQLGHFGGQAGRQAAESVTREPGEPSRQHSLNVLAIHRLHPALLDQDSTKRTLLAG